MGSKGMALIAQMVREFGMNPKVWGLSPPRAEIYSFLKKLTLSQKTSVRLSKMNILARAQLNFQMLTLLKQNHTYSS